MEGVWLPFEGFQQPTQGDSGMLQKPEIAHTPERAGHQRINSVFPPEIAAWLRKNEPQKWGRFKSMECLYVSYLLSGDKMDTELRQTIESYIPVEVREQGTLEPSYNFWSWSGCCNCWLTELEEKNISKLNKQLEDNGASLGNLRLVEAFPVNLSDEAELDPSVSNPISNPKMSIEEDASSDISEEEKMEIYPENYRENNKLQQFIVQLHNKGNVTREHRQSFSDLKKAGENKKDDDLSSNDRDSPTNTNK